MTRVDFDKAAFTDLIDLAALSLGGAVLDANDEFFAEKENLLKPAAPVFLEHEYTDRGKWMDGWETRRKRGPGHDHCIVRLGLPGLVRGVVIDTAFFRGNYPAEASIDACATRVDASPALLASDATKWFPLLPREALEGDSKNAFAIDGARRVTHLRLNIFPDGGVARLRVHGEVVPDWTRLGRDREIFDVAAVENGGVVLSCSDMFFGVRHNLILPGRSVNMGGGWETKRRRGPGHDWALLKLATESELRRVEVDTNHFKGNYPDTCRIVGARTTGSEPHESDFVEVLARTKLEAHTRHDFEDELLARGPFTHLRLEIFPDGGVSRLRVWGSATRGGIIDRRLARFETLVADEAERELLACCGSKAWAAGMVESRPFRSLDGALARADAMWASLDREAIREAFLAHPRIGEKKAARDQGATARAWSSAEQAGTASATAETMSELAELNRAYEEKFGHVFLICATGKSASEILAALKARLASTAEAELRTAAEEQRQITRLRLEKMFG